MLGLELRPDHRGQFDELIARFADGLVHAEMMDDNAIYIDFTWDDGRHCQFWLRARGKLSIHHEQYAGKPPRFTAAGVDRGASFNDLTITDLPLHAQPNRTEG